MKKLLTVIVPVYNDAKNISRCLLSLFNQEYKDIEIIVVDDHSSDNTVEVLYSLLKQRKFQIINMQQNSGAGSCRNAGILAAKTPYVTFIDSDDWVDIGVYKKCIAQMEHNPDVIIYELCYDYVKSNYREYKYKYPDLYETTGEFCLYTYTHTIPTEIGITPIVNNKIYRREFLLENDFLFCPDLRYQEDDVFTFQIFTKAQSVILLGNVKYHYCQRQDSLIHTVSEFSVANFVEAYKTLQDYLKNNDLFEEYKNCFYMRLKISFMGVINRILLYETTNRNKLICNLIIAMLKNFNIEDFLDTFNYDQLKRLFR